MLSSRNRTTTGSKGSISNSKCRVLFVCIRTTASPKQKPFRFNRRNLFARDGNLCQYCGNTFPTSELSLDHVMPRSRGGEASWENIVCACVECNVRKGGRTPTEAGMKLIRQPQKPKRSPLLALKLGNPKYESWKTFLDNAYWDVDLSRLSPKASSTTTIESQFSSADQCKQPWYSRAVFYSVRRKFIAVVLAAMCSSENSC